MKNRNAIGRLIAGCALACCFISTIHAQLLPGGGGSYTNGTGSTNTLINIPNYQKYIGQVFSVINTNDAAYNDTNLFNALLAFSDDTNTTPILQILPYQSNCLLLKASHFDYSGENARDFALVVNDKVEVPLYRTVDASTVLTNQNGWLIQGTVPHWQVADPMYFVVSNISRAYNAFFQVIPYGGPQVTLSGYNAYDTVSNTITLHAQLTDLSGITNEQFSVTVDGAPARYSLGASNTISLQTQYNQNGPCTVYATAANTALIFDPTNLPDNAKLNYSGSSSLPLDFENDTYLAFASDYAEPSIGTNYFAFVINKPQSISASISDPSNGHIVAYFTNYVPYAATIELPWNFTEGDGVTPYSNNTYTVTFTAYDPSTIVITNTIDRYGVRKASANLATYEREDPNISGGSYLNAQATEYIDGMVIGLYGAIYDNNIFSITMYDNSQIGDYRNNPPSPALPLILTQGSEQSWANNTLLSLTNVARYSDFNFYMGHGNGAEIGGGPAGSTFVKSYLDATTAHQYAAWDAAHSGSQNWRMRKVALWACYTYTDYAATAGGAYKTWPEALGIRSTTAQNASLIMKNVGLFFGEGLPQGGYSGTYGGTSAEVAAQLEDLWVAGPYPYPGACDPTFAFSWAVSQLRGMNPELDAAQPVVIGFQYLPYAGVYDSELQTNDVSHVSR